MITKLIMWWLHRRYVKEGMPLFYIKGTGRNYPKYLLFTEDEQIYKRMDRF